MIVCRTLAELSPRITEYKRLRESTGLVPTMGALHEGHLALVQAARARADRVIVSIFVNPTQFGPGEDYERYPRTPERDLELLEREGVDLVWLPEPGEMYGRAETTTVDPGVLSTQFEGAIRPHHFRGVLTVVAKLFHQTQPDVALFGQKDAQQLFLVRRMVAELRFPLEVVEVETVREADGLAKSSRNVYLKQAERERAGVLWRALAAGKRAIAGGERSLPGIEHVMQQELATVGGLETQYATVVSEAAFASANPIQETGRLIIAVKLGPVRLIDNDKYGFGN
ncbi:pantoate--beta-alanine ligase [candidate division KSB1 bacterium]|nr:pantoate--beta-alanine ligase [candidate division KSB1 bacterium]